MKKNFFLFIVLMFISGIASADQQTQISKANKAYQEGFYENAITLYQGIINDGYTSASLYYNLGNAYFKIDRIPEAILHYERARKLDPMNEDIQYNLRIANGQIIDKIDQLPLLFYERWWNSIKQVNSPNGWAYTTLFFLFIFFISLAIFFLTTNYSFRKALIVAASVFITLTVVSFIVTLQLYKEVTNKRDAIVFAATLPVKSSPEESGIDLFVIHEGLKVKVIDEIGEWKEIKIDNGSKGWVKTETLEVI